MTSMWTLKKHLQQWTDLSECYHYYASPLITNMYNLIKSHNNTTLYIAIMVVVIVVVVVVLVVVLVLMGMNCYLVLFSAA